MTHATISSKIATAPIRAALRRHPVCPGQAGREFAEVFQLTYGGDRVGRAARYLRPLVPLDLAIGIAGR